MTPPHDPLDPLLDRWGVSPEQRPLAPEVWRKLATAERPVRRPEPRMMAWWRALDVVFGRASFAAAFVIACALLGLFLAELRVSHLRDERDRQLTESYLRLIDPLVIAAAAPAAPPKPAHPGS
jgi:hypothetical protein